MKTCHFSSVNLLICNESSVRYARIQSKKQTLLLESFSRLFALPSWIVCRTVLSLSDAEIRGPGTAAAASFSLQLWPSPISLYGSRYSEATARERTKPERRPQVRTRWRRLWERVGDSQTSVARLLLDVPTQIANMNKKIILSICSAFIKKYSFSHWNLKLSSVRRQRSCPRLRADWKIFQTRLKEYPIFCVADNWRTAWSA